MAIWAQRYARQQGIPAVASFHTHFVSYFRYYGVPRLEGFGWRMLRRFYERCDRVYAPSASIIAELAEHGVGDAQLGGEFGEGGKFFQGFVGFAGAGDRPHLGEPPAHLPDGQPLAAHPVKHLAHQAGGG